MFDGQSPAHDDIAAAGGELVEDSHPGKDAEANPKQLLDSITEQASGYHYGSIFAERRG